MKDLQKSVLLASILDLRSWMGVREVEIPNAPTGNVLRAWLEAFNSICKAAALLTLGIATALPTCAQSQAGGNSGQAVASAPATPQAGAASKPTFDAASVRISTQEFVIKGMDFLNPAGDEAPPPGGLFSWNVSLPWLISFAYDLRSGPERRGAREALPKWAQNDWFTIEARAEGNPTREQVRQMVRSLLEERFQFAAHLEKREGQVYALVVAKPGLGLKPHPEGAPCTLALLQVNEYPNINPSYKAVPAHCGVFNRELSHSGERRFEMLDVTLQQVADSLSLGISPSVVDRSGLIGHYDAVLDFGPDDMPSNAGSSDDAIGLPSVSGALEKQLGLKLVKQTAQVDVLVIDYIGKLSAN
jgi:uncharacterized protein (TIGR03435 family)